LVDGQRAARDGLARRVAALIMEVALGLKAHSGWAVLVAVAAGDVDPIVIDRRRIELVDEEWQRQPYHAAERLEPHAARKRVEAGVTAAHRGALRELRAALAREQQRGNDVVAGAVLMGSAMPDWSVAEVLAVHFRMHKAEGVLFRGALARAVEACKLRLVAIPEQGLAAHAARALGATAASLAQTIAVLGKAVGAPWGKDQKDAALAALVALRAPVPTTRPQRRRQRP
jgi:hypothetical protein